MVLAVGEERAAGLASEARDWWRHAVIYQVYPRSFSDANGDGIGDLAGVRSRLPYLASLGIDAIWFTPWYRSPLADGGYDVADYRAIDPAFGTLEEAEALIADAAAMGIRTIVDVVPNHVSSDHPWFRAALAAGPGSPERDRFWFRPGRGPNGDGMPTNWPNNFGGTTWTRTSNPDGTPGDWYLHLFSVDQPDLNWDHPDVGAEHESILRFWFDRGVGGIRVDSAALLVKDPAMPEVPEHPAPGGHPIQDRDELHDIYRAWRAVADGYPGDRILVGEIWLPDVDRFARYLRPDELHTAFNFDYLARPWDAQELRASIELTLAAHAPVGAPPTWVLENHDVTRVVTRYGQADSSFAFTKKRPGIPTDLALGRRRARAAALLAAALPGALYLYQGEELGLEEVQDLPHEQRTDPMYLRSGGADPGRDGCRVPLPWSGALPPFGFSPDGATAEPWLRQPTHWSTLTVEAQDADPASMLNLYRALLRMRRLEPDFELGCFAWLDSPAGVLAFARGSGVICVANLTTGPVDLPPHGEVLLTSAPLEEGRLPADTTAWLRTAPEGTDRSHPGHTRQAIKEEELHDLGPNGATPTGRGPTGSVPEHE
jgi:alpha-glucosidase